MIPRSNSHHSGDGKRREVIRIHLNVILAMGITRLKAWYGNSMPVGPQTYVETPYVWLVCNFVRRNSHHTTKMSWMVWAGQSLHMSPVWNYVIYWGMMTPWIDSLALRKKGTRTKKKSVWSSLLLQNCCLGYTPVKGKPISCSVGYTMSN
jgi:hypothetical protein